LRGETNTTATFAWATRASGGAGCGSTRKATEARGAVVPDEFYRTGRRHRRTDGKGDCVRKPGNRQRKATLAVGPYHPELAAACASLMDPASARAGLKGGVMSEIF